MPYAFSLSETIQEPSTDPDTLTSSTVPDVSSREDSSVNDDVRRTRLTKAVVSTLEVPKSEYINCSITNSFCLWSDQRLVYPVEGGEPLTSTQSLVIKLIEHKAQGLGLHSASSIVKNIQHITQVRYPVLTFFCQTEFTTTAVCAGCATPSVVCRSEKFCDRDSMPEDIIVSCLSIHFNYAKYS